MLIVPAIDLQEGTCVRLKQGAFDSATRYGDPVAQIQAFADAGAEWVHVVDLDGARLGAPAQLALVGRLASEADVRIQCGGGVRERAHIEALLEAGAARVVVGSAAVRRPEDIRRWISDFGAERICCAFDVRRGGNAYEVAVDGWTASAGVSLSDALALYPPGELRHVLATDISRDGVLTGANVELVADLVGMRPELQVQASGGVASLEDLAKLRRAGAAAAIVGRALYERRFTLEAALAG